MPYAQEISRQNKACFLFLVDQSYSMVEPLGNSPNRKCDELVTAINAWLANMVIRASGSEGVKDWVDIGVIGYRTDEQENPIIGPPFQGALAGQTLASITDIAWHSQIVQRTQLIPDAETGENIECPVEVPVWVEPVAGGGTPMCHALYQAHQVLEQWIGADQRSFPPILIHITDGETTDNGDPLPYAEAIQSLQTEDGNVLLFNCHLSATAADSFMFPHSDEILPDQFARLLFKMSSVIPPSMYDRAVAEGFTMQPGSARHGV